MSSIFETTSEAIRDWRRSITSRLSTEPGFAAALEEDASRQRAVVSEWLNSPNCFKGLRLYGSDQHGSGTSVTSAIAPRGVGRNAKRVLTTSGAVDIAINDAVVCTNAIDAVSVSASHSFQSEIDEVRLHGVAKADHTNLIDMSLKIPASNTSAAYEDFRHEAFIGMFATNFLRPRIPNFPFVYAYLTTESVKTSKAVARRVASPRRKILDSETEASKACPAMLVEDIGEATNATVASAIAAKTHFETERDFAELLIQIAFALKTASQEVSFTHYDLQAGNVILRPLVSSEDSTPTRAYIPYEDAQVYVSAKWVATFVEFGFAHASVVNSEGRRVSFGFAAKGKAELVELGIFRDRENPMTDIYRFMLTSAAVAIKAKNEPVLNVLRVAFKYFNATETLEDAVASQSENYFYLPLTSKTRVFNFEDFVTFVKREARVEKWVTDVRALTINTMSNGTVPKRGSATGSQFAALVQKRFGPWGGATLKVTSSPVAHTVIPDTFTGFFDSYTSLTARVETETASLIARGFSTAYIQGFSEGKSMFNASLANLRNESARCAAAGVEAAERGDVSVLVSLISRLIDMRQATVYAVDVYWREGEAPPEIKEVRTQVDAVINTMIGRLNSTVTKTKIDEALKADLVERHGTSQ